MRVYSLFLTLRVAAGLYEGVWPLTAAGQGTEGQAGVTRDTIGRDQGARACTASCHYQGSGIFWG